MAGWVLTAGDAIGRRLHECGLTQAALADAAGVSRYRVNSIINGARRLTPDSAKRIGRALGMTPISLLELQNCSDLFALDQAGVGNDVTCITPPR
jgi:addiction module HigA family antidote